MFSEVNISVEDGNLGRNASTGITAQAKIGVSGVKSSVPILITNTMSTDTIKEKLGNSPLADACIDATENGLKTIYAFPVNADVKGTISDIVKTGTSQGNITVEGEATNAFDVVIKITESGDVNEGAFQYSIDGGNVFSEDITIPLSGSYEINGTGLTVKFADAEESSDTKSFLEDDVYSFSTTVPTMNNASVLDAVEKLRNYNKEVELCHIVGTSTKTLWAALQSEANELLEIYKKPLIFMCEARACQKDETLDVYMDEMDKERKGISSRYISVCLSYATYVRKDLRTQNINMAGVLTGLIGNAKESLSIGNVENFPISSAKCLKLIPEGIEEYSREFDAMGYTVLRQYTGKDDFYVSNGNVMAPAGSDFPYIESVRVLNRIVRQVSMAATDKVQCEVDPNNLEASIAPIQSHLNIPMEDCVKDKVISSGEVEIVTDGLNILSDETLDVKVEWVPMGTARKFNITFSVNNPANS